MKKTRTFRGQKTLTAQAELELQNRVIDGYDQEFYIEQKKLNF
jgi:hypothetical protein